MYTEEQIYTICKAYDISKLDVNRIYRYIDKFYNKVIPNTEQILDNSDIEDYNLNNLNDSENSDI